VHESFGQLRVHVFNNAADLADTPTHHRRRGAQEHRHLRDGSGDEDRFSELDAAICNEGCNVFD
jgi:hypothetical protein